MTQDQAELLAVCVLAIVCLLLAVGWARARGAVRRTGVELDAVRERLDALERTASEGHVPAADARPVEFVITDLGAQEEPPAEPVRLETPAFADIVLKETVVKAASLVHGVRRGLAPETRNRIRFEMRQEVRRSRKQRRADLKTAQRDLHARQRAGLIEDVS